MIALHLSIVGLALLFELVLVLSLVPAPLISLTADSAIDEVVPALQVLGQPLHERMQAVARTLDVRLEALAAAAQLASWLTLFVPYAVVLLLLRRGTDPFAGRVVLGFSLLFVLTALFSRRMFSTDLFSYVLNGRIFAIHGGNPYVDMPAQFADDPFLPLVVWREVPSHYGPLWTFVSAGVAAIGGEQIGLTFLLFRGVAALATVSVSVLIWLILLRRAPDKAALGVAIWAWNPLVIVEGAGSGHNDAVLALFLILAVAALAGRRAILGSLALAAGVSIKYSAVVLAPLYGVVLLRRAGFRACAAGASVAVLLTALSLMPFRQGDVLPARVHVSSPARYLNSPAELVFTEGRRWLGDDSSLKVEQIEFRPWWAVVQGETELFLERGRIPIADVASGTTVLATDRPDPTWQRVYDPFLKEAGYVRLALLRATIRPPEVEEDAELRALEQGRAPGVVADLLNRIIRTGGWLILGVATVLLLRTARDVDGIVSGWLITLTLVYLVVATWFFPWYLIWGLAIAALRPGSLLSWALIVWSASSLVYYAVAPFEFDASLSGLYRWRAIPMFALPIAIIIWVILRRRLADMSAAPPRAAETAHRRLVPSGSGRPSLLE